MRSAAAINRISRAREQDRGPREVAHQGLRCQFFGRRFADREQLREHLDAEAQRHREPTQ